VPGTGEGRAAYDKVEPIIQAFANRTFYVSEFGCGMKAGQAPELIHEVISGSGSRSAARSWWTRTTPRKA
jgi:hypothetical protein